MATAKATFKVADHFAKSEPSVRATYTAILRAARALGRVREEPKKTSIHLVREKAFAGIATRRNGLTLTLKAQRRIAHPRVHRAEQASANRWHVEVRLAEPAEVDAELAGWIKQAYELA
jgi:Domain of unknown function (DUF5655)